MRLSIWFGIIFLALGFAIGILPDELLSVSGPAKLSIATTLSAIIFIIFSGSLIGLGAALVLHWIIGFAAHSHTKAYIAEVLLSFATFFVGLGAAFMSGNIWTGLHIFISFFSASIGLFNLSIINLFGTFAHGFERCAAYIKKKKKSWSKK